MISIAAIDRRQLVVSQLFKRWQRTVSSLRGGGMPNTGSL